MTKKNVFLCSVISFITAIIFFWNQCAWAIGLETIYGYPSNNPQKNLIEESQKLGQYLSQNLHKTSLKVFCRFIEAIAKEADFEAEITSVGAKNTLQTCVTSSGNDRLGRIDEKYGTYDGKKYKWQAISYDELGRPTAYKEKYGKVSSKHYDIIYNELGDVAYEKIKVSAKSGTGIFSSKTKILTEYWYGYDEYGQHEKIKENEIYRKVSTNPIGTIIKAVVGIVTAAFTAGMGIWVTAAWMAAENFVFSILSGADFKQALLSAAISYIATIAGAAVGGYLSGGAQGVTQAFSSTFTGTLFERFTAFFQNFTTFDVLFQALSLIDQLMVDEEGKGLFEQIFGKWGSVVLSAISIFSGFLSGNVNGQGPPSQYQIFGAIGRVIVSALVTAFKDKLGPEWSQALSAFFSQLFVTYANQETAQKEQIKTLEDAGYIVETDFWGNITDVYLPRAIENYGNALAENIATGGADTIIKATAGAIKALTKLDELQNILANGTPQELKDWMSENGLSELGLTELAGALQKGYKAKLEGEDFTLETQTKPIEGLQPLTDPDTGRTTAYLRENSLAEGGGYSVYGTDYQKIGDIRQNSQSNWDYEPTELGKQLREGAGPSPITEGQISVSTQLHFEGVGQSPLSADQSQLISLFIKDDQGNIYFKQNDIPQLMYPANIELTPPQEQYIPGQPRAPPQIDITPIPDGIPQIRDVVPLEYQPQAPNFFKDFLIGTITKTADKALKELAKAYPEQMAKVGLETGTLRGLGRAGLIGTSVSVIKAGYNIAGILGEERLTSGQKYLLSQIQIAGTSVGIAVGIGVSFLGTIASAFVGSGVPGLFIGTIPSIIGGAAIGTWISGKTKTLIENLKAKYINNFNQTGEKQGNFIDKAVDFFVVDPIENFIDSTRTVINTAREVEGFIKNKITEVAINTVINIVSFLFDTTTNGTYISPIPIPFYTGRDE